MLSTHSVNKKLQDLIAIFDFYRSRNRLSSTREETEAWWWKTGCTDGTTRCEWICLVSFSPWLYMITCKYRLQAVSLLLWNPTGMIANKVGVIDKQWVAKPGSGNSRGHQPQLKESLQWFLTTFLMPGTLVTKLFYWLVYEVMTCICHYAGNLHTVCKTIWQWRSRFRGTFNQLSLCACMSF